MVVRETKVAQLEGRAGSSDGSRRRESPRIFLESLPKRSNHDWLTGWEFSGEGVKLLASGRGALCTISGDFVSKSFSAWDF